MLKLNKLPTSYQSFGSTIKVVERGPEHMVGCTDHGYWSAPDLEIGVSNKLKPDGQFHAFLHEFTHQAFEACGRGHESADELFVDTFAGLLAQFLKTAKYE